MLHSRREVSKLKCRLRILDTSRRLFKEKGYEDTMIEEVAELAEVSKATVYNYFPSKEWLLLGAMKADVAELGEYIENLDDSLNSYEKIKKAMTYQILRTRPYIDLCRRILFLNSYSNSPLYRKVDEMYDFFTVMAEEGKKEGTFRKEIPTESIVSMINVFYLYAQFNWRDLETLPEEECRKKIVFMLDLAMSGCLTTS